MTRQATRFRGGPPPARWLGAVICAGLAAACSTPQAAFAKVGQDGMEEETVTAPNQHYQPRDGDGGELPWLPRTGPGRGLDFFWGDDDGGSSSSLCESVSFYCSSGWNRCSGSMSGKCAQKDCCDDCNICTAPAPCETVSLYCSSGFTRCSGSLAGECARNDCCDDCNICAAPANQDDDDSSSTTPSSSRDDDSSSSIRVGDDCSSHSQCTGSSYCQGGRCCGEDNNGFYCNKCDSYGDCTSCVKGYIVDRSGWNYRCVSKKSVKKLCKKAKKSKKKCKNSNRRRTLCKFKKKKCVSK